MQFGTEMKARKILQFVKEPKVHLLIYFCLLYVYFFLSFLPVKNPLNIHCDALTGPLLSIAPAVPITIAYLNLSESGLPFLNKKYQENFPNEPMPLLKLLEFQFKRRHYYIRNICGCCIEIVVV